MKHKRIIQLLELTKTTLDNSESCFGICKALSQTYYHTEDFSENEYEYLKEFLFANKPRKDNQYVHYTYSPYWHDDEYWWKPINIVPRAKQVRIDYLNELIKNIKNDNHNII